MKEEHSTTLGYISACIAGDYRYSTRIDVVLDTRDGTVEVRRLENGAVGGMDGPGGSYPMDVKQRVTIAKPTGKDIVRAIKMVMDTTIKTYGKPSKRFTWTGGQSWEKSLVGLSAKNAQMALDAASKE
jgi:hypothetical protein